MVPLPGVAFTGLLVLVVAGSTVHGTVIPEPQNVMLKCENQFPIVQWDYSHQQPQTVFKVNISGSAGTHEYETTEHRFNLSEFIWESEDRYMAYHAVTVTAVMGGIKSNSVKPIAFTYNEWKPADKKCELDFPPVTLAVDQSEATVSFQNPFSFYPELKKASKPKSAFFQFKISAGGSDYVEFCQVDQKICKYDFAFSDNVTCIKLEGLLMEGNMVGRVLFRKEDVCRSPSMGDHWRVVIIILAVFGVLLIIVIFVICKERAWTLKIPLPDPLVIPDPNPRYHQNYSALDPNAVISHAQVEHRMASVSSMEEEEVSPTAALWDGSSGPGPQYSPRDPYREGELSDSSSSQEAMGLMSEGQTTDDDSANGSVETESVSMTSTEGEGEAEGEAEVEEPSPYDRPHILQIDMGEGDIVVAYTGS